MMRMEFYKIFVKQKAYLYLLIILLIKIIHVFASGYDSYYMIDDNEDYYLEYIHQYEGKITEETKAAIEQEYERIYHSTDSGYLAFSQKNAFQVLYHQFTQQKDGGYILDTRGWQSILEHDDIDYILLLGIVIISTLLFSTEYDTDMQAVLLTCRKGKYKSVRAKLCLGMAAGAVLSGIFQLIKYLYLCSAVGIAHGDYPLDCLEFFEDTIWRCSLQQACLLVFFIRMLGAVFASLAAMAVIILLKKTVVSMIVSVFLYLAADIMLSQGSAAYFTPLGLLKAAGYFWPSQYTAFISDGGIEKVCTFEELSKVQMCCCIVSFLFIMALIFVLGFCSFSKAAVLRNGAKKRKAAAACLMLCVILCVFPGCASDKSHNEKFDTGSSARNQFVCEEYTLDIDFGSNNIIYRGSMGEEYPLIREVVPLQHNITCIFVWDGVCYYLMENNLDSGIYVRSIDMDTLADKFVYSNMEENTEDFYGLLSREQTVEEIFEDAANVRWFFVTDQYIFFQKNNSITRIGRLTGFHKKLTDKASEEAVTYENGVLTYIDIYGEEIRVEN